MNQCVTGCQPRVSVQCRCILHPAKRPEILNACLTAGTKTGLQLRLRVRLNWTGCKVWQPHFSLGDELATRVLIISNGYGEDSIAAELVRHFPSGFVAAAYPTLGAGLAYQGICPIVGPRRFLPSEGLRRRGSLLKDARAGFGIRAALGFMRREARGYDAIIVVGDLLGVVMSWLTVSRVAIFLDVYKSGYANRYAAIETFIIRQTCGRVLSRDELLAASLRRSGFDAAFAGNVLMDALVRGTYDARSRRNHNKAIAILPGSRSSAAVGSAARNLHGLRGPKGSTMIRPSGNLPATTGT